MTSDRTLAHVTLTSGHVRATPRSEVRDEVAAELEPLILQALRGEHIRIPGVEPRCTLTGGMSIRESRRPQPAAIGPRGRRIPARRPVYGEAIALTVWGPPDVAGVRPPIATVGIAPSESGAEQLWRSLHEHTAGVDVVTSVEDLPPAPWCAARLDIGAAIYPDAVRWLGDLERCLAWSWIELRGR